MRPNCCRRAIAHNGTARPLKNGRLLLIADQGYGDVIQFARYIPWAARRCPDVAVACSSEIRPVVTQQPCGTATFDH
jgi:hypothetical protein